MKYLLIFALCVTLSLASNEFAEFDEFSEKNNGVSEEIKFKVAKDVLDGLKSDLDNAENLGGTTAVINEYADQIFVDLQKFVFHEGMDPLMLPNISQKFLAEKINLNMGNMQGLSTLHRYQDVTVTYLTENKVLEVDLPVAFNDLYFGYDYSMKILFIHYKGGLEGKLQNFRLKMVLKIDFNTYHITLKSNDIMSSGHVSLHFTGHYIDVLVNLLSEFVTTVLHPLIVGIIQLMFSNMVNKITHQINTAIDSIFHPVEPVGKLFFNDFYKLN